MLLSWSGRSDTLFLVTKFILDKLYVFFFRTILGVSFTCFLPESRKSDTYIVFRCIAKVILSPIFVDLTF